MKNLINYDTLSNYPIFNNLNKDEIKKFSIKMEINHYTKNEIIIKEGNEGHSILFLLDGEINISKALTLITNKFEQSDNREKELIRLNSKEHNISFGEISLFNTDTKRSATVKATSDCKVARLDFNDLFEICNSKNEIGYKVMKNLSKIITKHLIDSDYKVLKLTTAFSLLIDD